MTITLGLLALALCSVGVAAFLRGVRVPRSNALERVRQVKTYGFTSGSMTATEPRERRPSPILALSTRLGDALPMQRYEEWMRRRLVSAAIYRVSARTIAGLQLFAGLAFGLLAAAAGVVDGVLAQLGFALVAGGFAWVVPLVVVHGRASRRLDQIDRQTPDLIDMLVVTLEAGLGFGASLDAASQRMPAPIGDEIRLMMQEHRMGLGLTEAMNNTLQRVPTPNLSSFIRAVTQGQELGVSMGTIMRNLAVEMRVRRRQRAEEQAHKAPVKMLFPLIFLMFPALGIVILGPAMFEITEKLGGGALK